MNARTTRRVVWAILAVLMTVGFLIPLGYCYIAVSVVNQLGGDGRGDRLPVPQDAPEWTPDGSQIVFAHRGGIYAVNRDGSDLKRVHGSDGEDYHSTAPRLSPDGARIAYSRYLENRAYWTTMTSALDGSDERTLTKSVSEEQFGTRHRPQSGHAWSHDGSRIAFFNGFNLYTIGADGSGLRRLAERDFTGGVSPPVWSPDGSRITFAGSRQPGILHMVETDGSGATELVKEESAIGIGYPTWSPDGNRIAFAKWSGVPGEDDLYSWQVITLSGSGLDTVHQIADGLYRYSRVYGDFYGGIYGLDWSPDGENLLISGYNFVSAVGADGADLRTLVNLHPGYPGYLKASWSPDGSRIAVYNGRRYESALFTMSPDGSDKRSLTQHDGNPLRPAQNQAWNSAHDAPTPTPMPAP